MLALAGGVGGAKLADGFAQVAGQALTVIVNTADDFEHIGLYISPDIDTVVYTLSGIANPTTGWGIAHESWSAMEALETLGGPVWFRLGDKDLAMHLHRTGRMREGGSLSDVTREACHRLGIRCLVIPMSDDPVRTIVVTPDGELGFQEYFVRLNCMVSVRGFRFDGIGTAKPCEELITGFQKSAHDFVAICPSNPFVSIDPILFLGGVRPALRERTIPAIAISPIIGGAAVKGPAAKMMAELGIDVSSASVARHYRGLIDGFVMDSADAGLQADVEAMGISVHITETLMRNRSDRKRLAEECIEFAGTLEPRT